MTCEYILMNLLREGKIDEEEFTTLYNAIFTDEGYVVSTNIEFTYNTT